MNLKSIFKVRLPKPTGSFPVGFVDREGGNQTNPIIYRVFYPAAALASDDIKKSSCPWMPSLSQADQGIILKNNEYNDWLIRQTAHTIGKSSMLKDSTRCPFACTKRCSVGFYQSPIGDIFTRACQQPIHIFHSLKPTSLHGIHCGCNPTQVDTIYLP